MVLTYYLLEERRADDVIIKKNFANSLSHKTNRFHVAVRLSSNWSKKTLKYDMAFVRCHHFFLGAWLQKTRSRCWGYNFTNILKEFVRALMTREKKTRYVLWINWVSIHNCYASENTSWNIKGNIGASKVSMIFNCVCFSLWLGETFIFLSSVIYQTG